MWTGSPEATASVAKIRRKSCGVNRAGVPSAKLRPLVTTIRSSKLNAPDGVIITFVRP